jgi:hypothetical protein
VAGRPATYGQTVGERGAYLGKLGVSISGGSSREEEDGASRMQLMATLSSLAGISKLEESSSGRLPRLGSRRDRGSAPAQSPSLILFSFLPLVSVYDFLSKTMGVMNLGNLFPLVVSTVT